MPSGALPGGTSFTPSAGGGGSCGCKGGQANGASPTPRVGSVPRPSQEDAFVGTGFTPTVGPRPTTAMRQPPRPQVAIPRGPRTPINDNGGWRGNVPVPTMKTDPGTPQRTPVTLVLKDTPLAPGPTNVVLTNVPMPTALQPLPGRPYCADARLAGTELCAGAQVSEMCATILANWLKANPQAPLSAFLASSSAMGEFCASEFERLLAPSGTKASSGLPNYWRASGDAASDARDAEWNRQRLAALAGNGIDPAGGYLATAADWTHGGAANLGFGGVGGETYAPPTPASPPVDYGALVAGIGTAVGASLSGLGSIVNNANNGRLRELEIEYANNARGAQLALQRTMFETQSEIARLSAAGTPQASAVVGVLQQQIVDMNTRLAALPQPGAPTPWTTGEIVGAVAAGAAVVGLIGFLALRK